MRTSSYQDDRVPRPPNHLRLRARTGQSRPWRRWQDWVSLLLGLWLFVTPWVSQSVVLHLPPSALNASSLWALGAVVTAMAMWALARPSLALPEWVLAVVGFWMFISLSALGFPRVTGLWGWDQWAVGLFLFVLAVWTL